MGFQSLDSALAFPENIPPAGFHIIITDTLAADGSFLLHHFIANQLKAEQPLVLVGLTQIVNHYVLIARKLVRRFVFHISAN